MTERTDLVHVAGARPNFPKLAPVHRALANLDVSQKLVHTGQHFDEQMSGVFFRELELPEPDINLGAGGGSGIQQIARAMTELEYLLTELQPKWIVVYGDVNSTVASALVGARMGIPVAHVEAGLRSFDRRMPEEINRIVTDQICDQHFATSQDAVEHLLNEGVLEAGIHFVGNPMIDTLLRNHDRFDVSAIKRKFGLEEPYAVATLHRPSNVDSSDDARNIVGALHSVADVIEIVLPLHPRGRARLLGAGLDDHANVRVVDPLGYVDFMSLVRGSNVTITDSGGVQEETTIFGIPCLTLRENTERPVTISHGTNRLVSRESLGRAVGEVLAAVPQPRSVPPLWDGNAGSRIAVKLHQLL
ncbi:UDP-N-acetylglucosamine 2-epimerase (non-hydrolysing) [Isoptericola sp. CG 20/1183]|uniref:UDP-N-acetylglucosamine 2-epimerase (Non-hydrolysing) n=1 Tax=Isoptericola halotolerans TaxID=300560 RepID=A0ABX5EI33_9MICO|nr:MULTISPECIES: UDP-N-acetylglucosamine 2-epimerase (non-hydrolyzing) [Isoptericola]MCK0116294.1 UDP-N-acetylglucosamine 2-epimerase (non-hydrolyzing) [Isoptericola sp. S6320L]PRZ08110.1 UDP-N-acetylglucosamine 2-epimerase (non-hydrolysing) [Isoptericola halotolerans]PRZ08907.1 UDP-N-acetylglucosamine 2-epimerase (non-hydrolysing) [Isoptericola sp. CG 20/1183]